jgi:hypothetical protein
MTIIIIIIITIIIPGKHELKELQKKKKKKQPYWALHTNNGQARSPVTGLEWPRGFQEVKVPRIHDNGT